MKEGGSKAGTEGEEGGSFVLCFSFQGLSVARHESFLKVQYKVVNVRTGFETQVRTNQGKKAEQAVSTTVE